MNFENEISYTVFIDVTGCSNDWGMHIAPIIKGLANADCSVRYHIIVPKRYIQDNTLTFIPYCLMDAISKDQVSVHCIETADSNLSTHMITALLFQDAESLRMQRHFSGTREYVFILGKGVNYYEGLVKTLLEGYGLDDKTINKIQLKFEYIGNS